MDNKLVSVIIPTHNRPSHIVMRAIKSVVNQTYKNTEIIIVDDSDCDFPQRMEVANSIKSISSTIKYIKHASSRGGCAARNTGLKNAKGYYVAFLDDDDQWLPDKIEEQLRAFDNPNIALVYCGTIVRNEGINCQYVRNSVYKRGLVYEYLIRNNNFIGGSSNPLIKKDCLNEIGGFDEDMQSQQDYDLWLRLTKYYPINYVSKPLLKYYEHGMERISTDLDSQIAGRERIVSKYYDFLKSDSRAWYMRSRGLVPLYAKQGNRKKALCLWVDCVKKSPVSILKNMRQLPCIIFGGSILLDRFYKNALSIFNYVHCVKELLIMNNYK